MEGLRQRFPVLQELAYLNAGTCGPLPDVVADAARETIDAEVREGRWMPHFEARGELGERLRGLYARALGAREEDVAITNSTSEGLGRVLAGLGLGPGDEILTSDEEHPGLLGPLGALRGLGVEVRCVPLAGIHEHVSARTKLVACCHVGWVSGRLAPPELREVDVPVIYDGAQGVGAIALDMAELRCAAYSGPGQKWLCGADGTGMVYVEPEFGERVSNLAPAYLNFAETGQGLDNPLKETAARFDTSALPRESLAMSVAATQLLVDAGLPAVQERAVALAQRLAERLAEAARAVAPRGPSTLVAWEEADPAAALERLEAAGVVVRTIPGTPLLRASVGAWNDDSDLDRLLDALA